MDPISIAGIVIKGLQLLSDRKTDISTKRKNKVVTITSTATAVAAITATKILYDHLNKPQKSKESLTKAKIEEINDDR